MGNMFEKFNEMFGGAAGLQDLQKEIAEAATGNVEFKEVPKGDYEVKVTKLGLGETGERSKTPGMPMVKVWFDIIAGEYKGQKIFMNQTLTSAFGIHKMNEMLTAFETGIPVVFENFVQYDELLKTIFNEIDGKAEYQLAYGENNKGFSTYTIVQRY